MTREEYMEFANALKNNYTIDFDKLPEFCDMAIEALGEKKGIKKFIDHYKDEGVDTVYDAGRVIKDDNNFIIGYEMKGAEKTFSIGQPVYDEDKNLMGYLGIGLYEALNYSNGREVRIPVERWIICLPTSYCRAGKKAYTYWQTKKVGE